MRVGRLEGRREGLGSGRRREVGRVEGLRRAGCRRAERHVNRAVGRQRRRLQHFDTELRTELRHGGEIGWLGTIHTA